MAAAACSTNSGWSHWAESPMSLAAISWAEQGRCWPSLVLNTRQSGRKSIMGLFQFFDFLNEIGGFFEPPVDAGITHIGHRVQFAQALHHPGAYRTVRNFAVKVVAQILDDLVDKVGHGFLGNGPFLTRLEQAGAQFLPGKLLDSSIALDHHQPRPLNFFVRRVAMPARDALSPPTNRRSFAGSPRVNDSIILASASGATHNFEPRLHF